MVTDTLRSINNQMLKHLRFNKTGQFYVLRGPNQGTRQLFVLRGPRQEIWNIYVLRGPNILGLLCPPWTASRTPEILCPPWTELKNSPEILCPPWTGAKNTGHFMSSVD